MSNNQPSLQDLLFDLQQPSKKSYPGEKAKRRQQAIDVIYAAGLSAIGSDDSAINLSYWGDAHKAQNTRNELRAEQRKAWQRVCYGEEPTE